MRHLSARRSRPDRLLQRRSRLLSKTLAVELGGHGVTANAVAPGFVVGDLTAATACRLSRDVAEHQHLATQSIPVGRVGRPQEIAHDVSFLSSPQSGFVLGQVLDVAGGPVE